MLKLSLFCLSPSLILILLFAIKDGVAKQNSSTLETDLIQCLNSLMSVARRILIIMYMSVIPMRMLMEISNDKGFLRVVVLLVLAKVKHPTVSIHLDLQIYGFRIKIGLKAEEVLLNTGNSKSF